MFQQCRPEGMEAQAKSAHFTELNNDRSYQRLFCLGPQIFGIIPKYLEVSFMTVYSFVIQF